ncbi:MAG: carboxymuconolactone decarboxylase family protein [Ramlibacter sp.]
MLPDRLPPIPPEQWTAEQRRYAQEIIDGPRGALISPFVPMLRSPELMAHSQRLGEYLRYRSAIGLRLSELAILVVARHWTQQTEWAIHAPIALREGVHAGTVAAIAQGRRPTTMPDDEAIVHDFCIELQQQQQVSDATWARAIAAFGEQGVVDLVGVVGYYGYLAMLMNAARTPVPASPVEPLQPPPAR